LLDAPQQFLQYLHLRFDPAALRDVVAVEEST
jgi:hypothetical protein